jgi:hypothetical protein
MRERVGRTSMAVEAGMKKARHGPRGGWRGAWCGPDGGR